MKKQHKKKADEGSYGIIDYATPFHIKEAYKTLRTNLLFSMTAAASHGNSSNIIVISSSIPGEGKSTTCANLAISMSKKNEHVIIIDADMRKPVQNKLFNVENRRGLSTVLIKEHQLEESIVRDIQPSLDLLPSGILPPNPSELLSSESMKEVLARLSASYNYIFIDTPPISVVSDALVVSQNTAGILIAVRPNYCTHEKLGKIIENIRLANINILGIVMSNVPSESISLPYIGKYRYGDKYYKYKYSSKSRD